VLGIATVSLALWAVPPTIPSAAPPPLEIAPAPEPIDVHADCDAQDLTTIVIRGRLVSRASTDNHFSVALPGRHHLYGAITDGRGYFEMRIPRDDYFDELCLSNGFEDPQMTLEVRCHFERCD